MGDLIIRKVSYFGDNYHFESPELDNGINIIVGDNGSGKSTFSYFIEFGLGGNVKYFKRDNTDENYKLITQDFNNYVSLNVEIKSTPYVFKRFIGGNDIFVNTNNNELQRFSLNRNGQNSDALFSDWILKELGINVFELNMGTYSWIINFNDLYRLLNYDQETPPTRIYKAPSHENFVTESVIVRKAIFETLIGVSSQKYNDKFGELKKAAREKDETNSLFKNFTEMYSNLNENYDVVYSFINELNEQLRKLYETRNNYLKEDVNIDKKTDNIGEIQEQLIILELKISNESVRKNTLLIEKSRIENLVKGQKDEILQIEKIVYTHDKLNLFSLETCPFCGKSPNQHKGFCICGSLIDNKDYEKFVYNSSEYKDIISHRKKSLETIESALNSYIEEISQIGKNIEKGTKEALMQRESLKMIIGRIEYSGNSDLIDQTNSKIIETKEIISENEQLLTLLLKKKDLENAVNTKKIEYNRINKEFYAIQQEFETNNRNTIQNFNTVFNELMKLSTCDCNFAEIDNDYMPLIDHGEYKEKSARVPIRLMYYFAFFNMGLKYKNVKHPHFLLMDTPESEGIDEDNLKKNLLLLDKAIALAGDEVTENKKFQVIMTTGYNKYPDEYEKYVKLKFNKKNLDFILKERGETSSSPL